MSTATAVKFSDSSVGKGGGSEKTDYDPLSSSSEAEVGVDQEDAPLVAKPTQQGFLSKLYHDNMDGTR